MLKFLGKYRDAGLLFLRVGIGAAYIMHGLPKLTDGPKFWATLGKSMGVLGIHFLPTFWGFIAAATEGIGGILLVLGFCFRPVSLLMAFTMVVATLTMASGKNADFNACSHPLKMAIVFISLAFIGPGKLSIDKD